MKRMLTCGRGSNVGGTTLSTRNLSGNKFWKYLIWRFGEQLLPVTEVPDYMKEVTKSGNLVTKNHVSRNRKHITCSACHKADGNKNHGHDKNNLNCPQKAECAEEKIVKKRERDERKINVAKKLHKAASESSSTSLTLGRVLYQEPID
jgi:hypothetical protein